jgi:hypothetical protein
LFICVTCSNLKNIQIWKLFKFVQIRNLFRFEICLYLKFIHFEICSMSEFVQIRNWKNK